MMSEKQPIIFLVEEDDDTRPVLKRNLERDGYRVLLALNEEDALDRTVGGDHIKADLILVNLVGVSPDYVLKAARRIREHARYGGATPIVVMAEKYGKDLEGTDAQVGANEWITYLEDPHQLKNLLERILNRHSN
ncbi:MAG: response regulator [Pyrinomonadaceae bacterium]